MIARMNHALGPRFQFAVIMVRDQDRSLRFYIEQLGFRLVADQMLPQGGRWIVVEPPDQSLHLALVRPPENSAACRRIGEDTGLVLTTRDLAALCEKWSQRGVSFSQSPAEILGQVQTAVFDDIDGNRFTLAEYGPITEALDAVRRAYAEREKAEKIHLRELEIAKEVQAGLLPQHPASLRTLECAGMCIPAQQVGGDYYDFLEVGPGRVALVLADIAGKGISGALLMANLQANLRSQCATLAAFKEYFPLASDDFRYLLLSVNRLFHANTSDTGYATLFFGNYDDATRKLTYVNCGHPPALIVRDCADHCIVERLDATATVMGLFSDFDCRVVEKQLAAGDILIIYSDGITEAVDVNGEEFGEHRLLEIARANEQLPVSLLVKKLVESARAFSHGEQADDITVIAARCLA